MNQLPQVEELASAAATKILRNKKPLHIPVSSQNTTIIIKCNKHHTFALNFEFDGCFHSFSRFAFQMKHIYNPTMRIFFQTLKERWSFSS
ncbi:hypothetical protein RHMOL_Rhmol05G0156000 [Rhododendron molle]|uniref:Uncharacterized protein n=1 Tax=Rhododendron molle TaxID=49168 RepID=A0ACC0NP93_RHOML|nr:hypothetical protein RHMOL_Rhmol05G0156000 [Rhododendron molle]